MLSKPTVEQFLTNVKITAVALYEQNAQNLTSAGALPQITLENP